MSDLDVKIYTVNDAIKIEQIAYNKAIDDVESEFLKCENVHYNLQDILNVLNKVKAGASNENNS